MRITRRFGWKRQLPDFRDHPFMAALAHFPETVDLRGKFPKVYDQGNLGSCTGNAIAGICEYEWMRQGKPDPFIPSRLFIYYNERQLEGTVHSDSGAAIRDGIKAIHKWGFCPEDAWPYHISAFAHKPTSQAYVLALKEQVQDYLAVHQTLNDMKAALVSGYPIVLGFTVYDSFMNQHVADTGVVPMPGHGESVQGGHAVVVVGYDNPSSRFIVRNSWGEDWGQKGYFTIPYTYFLNSHLASDLWIVRLIP